MAEVQPERRKRDDGAPNALIQSYERMSPDKKRKLGWIGVGILVFTVALPLIAGIWVELPGAYWVAAFVGGIVGLVFIWPEAAIWVASSIPSAVVKMLPSRFAEKLLTTPDRRSDDEATEGPGE